MSDIDITLYLNKYRVRALSDALGDQTAETVEDKLAEAFDTLYQEYVPDEQRASIEARIERGTAQNRRGWKRPDALRFTTFVKKVMTITSQAITSAPRCKLRTDTASMSAASYPPTPKPSPMLLLKRILSTSNISTRSVQTSIRIIESLLCSNLIWMKVGSVFTTAWITNGKPTPCVIFPLRLIKHSAPITEARKGVVKYSIAALRGKNLVFRKNHQMILQYLI